VRLPESTIFQRVLFVVGKGNLKKEKNFRKEENDAKVQEQNQFFPPSTESKQFKASDGWLARYFNRWDDIRPECIINMDEVPVFFGMVPKKVVMKR